MRNNNRKINYLLALPFLCAMPVAFADIGLTLDAGTEHKRYKDADIDAILGLGIEYRGEKFNIDKDAMSYAFMKSDAKDKGLGIEAILKSNNRSTDIDDRTLFDGMDKRRSSIDIGARGIYKTGFGPVVMEMTRDVYASKGYEADLRIGGIEPHAEHWNGKREVKVAVLAGVKYQSDKVVDYHYGVKSNEATGNRAAYKAKAATTPYVGLETLFNITEKVSLNAGVIYERRDDEIKNSPLTNNKNSDILYNLGLTYWF